MDGRSNILLVHKTGRSAYVCSDLRDSHLQQRSAVTALKLKSEQRLFLFAQTKFYNPYVFPKDLIGQNNVYIGVINSSFSFSLLRRPQTFENGT